MVTPEVIRRVGPVDTIVCHTDFDGLCSAAKWMREGLEPYPGADDDARAIDTRIGTPSETARRIDRALRARPRDMALFGLVVRHLASGLSDPSLWTPIDAAAAELDAIEAATRTVAQRYDVFRLGPGRSALLPASCDTAAFVRATDEHGHYDKTLLLLMGQERASIAIVLDMDTVSLAARFDSGISFLALLGLSGGMPTLVSVPKERMRDIVALLAISPLDAAKIGL
jgi:hypothetical protein